MSKKQKPEVDAGVENDEYFLNFLALPAQQSFASKVRESFLAFLAAAAFPFVTTDKTPTLKYYASVLMHSTERRGSRSTSTS